jgi:hypothetical protein
MLATPTVSPSDAAVVVYAAGTPPVAPIATLSDLNRPGILG